MRYLKLSTTVTVQVGPFLAPDDGVTPKTGVSPTVYLSKAGAAQAARNSATAITHDRDGWYRVELNTTDTNTLGPLILQVTDAGTHLAVWHEFMVVPANVYDSLVGGSDLLQVDTTQIEGADATDTINAQADQALADIHLDHLLATTYDPASKPGAADALLNELVENDGGVSRYTANALEQAPSGSGPSAADIADAVWEEAVADHSGTAGSTAEALAAAGGAGDPWITTLPGSYTGSQAGKVLADVLADTAQIDSRVDVAVSTRSSHSAADVWAAGTRTLTSFGTLASDTATAVWAAGTRTLTSFGSLASDTATAVWATGTRTLTSFGSLVSDIWAGITGAAMDAIADHVLRRRMANVEASSDGDAIADAASLYGMTQQHRQSDTTTNVGKLTIFETDGTTELEQLDLDTDPAADPVTGIS